MWGHREAIPRRPGEYGARGKSRYSCSLKVHDKPDVVALEEGERRPLVTLPRIVEPASREEMRLLASPEWTMLFA
jgi:hypothetical protein